jgi:hypothetical protein
MQIDICCFSGKREIYDTNLKGITDLFLCPKNTNFIFATCEKIYRCGGNVW